MRKLALGLAVLLVLLVIPASAQASALKLTRIGGIFHSQTAARCDDAVSVTYVSNTSVLISGISGTCAGLPVTVKLWDQQRRREFVAAGVVAAGSTSLTISGSPAYTSSSSLVVSVTIGTWPIHATWSTDPPPVNYCEPLDVFGRPIVGGNCTLNMPTIHQNGTGTHHWANGTMTLTSPASLVSAVVDLSYLRQWIGWTPALITSNGDYAVGDNTCASTSSIVELVSNLAGGSKNFYFELYESAADAPAGAMRICPTPTIVPSQFAVSAPIVTTNPYYACVSQTVTRTLVGGVTYVPWTAVVDMAPAIAVITKAGLHAVSANMGGGAAAQYQDATHYAFSAKDAGLTSGSSVTVEACLSGSA